MAADSTRVFALGLGHDVTALAKSDGSVLWHVILPLPAGLSNGRTVLYVSGLAIVGDEDVFALDPATGAVRWRFTPSVGRGPGRWLMAARGDTVVTGSSSGDIYLLDARSGGELWRARLPDSLMSVSFVQMEDPVPDGDLILVRYTQRLSAFPFFLGGVAAFRVATGAFVWGRALPQPFPTTTVQVGAEGMAVADGVVVVTSYAGFVYAYDRATGAPRWTAPSDPAIPQFNSLPVADTRAVKSDGDMVFIGSGTGWITAFEAATGRQRWRANGGMGGTMPGIWTSGGALYTTHLGGQTTSYETATGAVRWRLDDTRARVTYGLLFDGNRVYGGDISGVVWAVAR